MGNNERTAELLSRLRVETNGAVSDSMRRRGISYRINYGVSVPAIKQIAKAYAPDHQFAKHLWTQAVRELKLAALYIADPAEVTSAELPFWGECVANTELAEHLASDLLSRTGLVGIVLERWLDPGNDLLAYAALMAAARSISLSATAPAWEWKPVMEKLATPSCEILSSEQAYIHNGIAALLSRLLQAVPASREHVDKIIRSAKELSLPAAATFEEELGWMLE